MSDLAEKAQWEDGIYQLETSDPVMGGPDGIDNLQAKQLANRTSWLKRAVDSLSASLEKAKNATTASIKAAGLHFGGLSSVPANEALSARLVGKLLIAPANGQILSLPPAASVDAGDTIPIRVIGGTWDGVHLHRLGEDVISDGLSVVTSMLLQAGSEVEFVSDGVATWYAGGSGAYHAHLVGKNFYATLNAGTASKLFTPDLIVYRGVYLVVPYYCGLQLTAGGDSYFLHASVDFISGHGEAHSTNQYHTTPQSYNWPPFALRVYSQTATIRCRVSFEGNTNSAGLITNFGDNRGNFAFFGARIA